jgi:hypothetical protein
VPLVLAAALLVLASTHKRDRLVASEESGESEVCELQQEVREGDQLEGDLGLLRRDGKRERQLQSELSVQINRRVRFVGDSRGGR